MSLSSFSVLSFFSPPYMASNGGAAGAGQGGPFFLRGSFLFLPLPFFLDAAGCDCACFFFPLFFFFPPPFRWTPFTRLCPFPLTLLSSFFFTGRGAGGSRTCFFFFFPFLPPGKACMVFSPFFSLLRVTTTRPLFFFYRRSQIENREARSACWESRAFFCQQPSSSLLRRRNQALSFFPSPISR